MKTKQIKVGYCRVQIIKPDITKVDRSVAHLYLVHPIQEFTPQGFPYINYIDENTLKSLHLEINKIYDTKFDIKKREFIEFLPIKDTL